MTTVLGTPTPLTAVFGAAPPADADTASLKSYARALCDIGLHVMLIEPHGKKPVDVRSPVQRRNEDGTAQDAARALGRADWDKVKSKRGVYLATSDDVLLTRYVERYRKFYESDYDDRAPINFAVAVGPSKLIVVDCDTRAQVEAFLRDSADAAGVAPNLDIPPTVKSPGQRNDAGEWVHRDGGHFYFTVDQPLPEYSGSLTAAGGYAVLWAGRYVLIPPSTREEGVYRLCGQDYPAPPWLLSKVNSAVTSRVSRMADAMGDASLSTAVDKWAATVGWDDLLSPYGWVPAARHDGCGCDIWTAPGDHASPKSATAHDVGCSLGRYTPDNAPLHIWTDNPGPELEAWTAAHGSKTLSRLQAVAALEYGGNVGEAMRELDVSPGADSEALAFGRDLSRDLGVSKSNMDGEEISPPAQSDVGSASQEDDANPFVPAGDQTGEEELRLPGVPHIMPFSHWRDIPPPEFAIEGLLEHRGFAAMVGAPGIGKTGIVLDMAAAVCTGRRWMGRKTMRQPVLYLPGEGLSGAVQRLRAWESAHDVDLGDDLYIGDSIIQVAASQEAWAAVIVKMLEHRIGLVVIDTFARASVGLEENSASDVGRAIARFDRVRLATNCGLLVVHHTNKAGGTRGSSALNGALDTEILIREGTWWNGEDGTPPGRPLDLLTTKQKNAQQLEEPLPLMAVSYGDSFVMTGPSGIVDDPLDGVTVPKALIPETVVSVAVRLQEFAQRFTSQGLTRQEFAYGVAPDDWTSGRRDARIAWRMRVNEAVDLGLRYNLLQTLTGSAAGARYIPDSATPDQARRKWAEENMIE